MQEKARYIRRIHLAICCFKDYHNGLADVGKIDSLEAKELHAQLATAGRLFLSTVRYRPCP